MSENLNQSLGEINTHDYSKILGDDFYAASGYNEEPHNITPDNYLVGSPKYMNLGAPRERDEDDHFHHEVNMQKLKGQDDDLNYKYMSELGLSEKRPSSKNLSKTGTMVGATNYGPIRKFLARYLNLHLSGPHFKLIKTETVGPHGVATKIKWGIMAAFVGISVASFLTQSVLFLKDYFTGQNISIASLFIFDNSVNNKVATSPTTPDGETRGSDDGRAINASSSAVSLQKKAQYKLNDIKNFPALSAKSFLVADIRTGEIIRESQDIGRYPVASVSKLMTGLVAYQKMDQKQMAIVSRSSYNTFGTQGELLLGESIRVSDLMYPLLMESSNDAAEVIADAYGHEKFMSEMNKKALALGMNDTYYEDPSGLSAKNLSTVEDQFKLGKYIFENAPVIFDLTRVRQFEILNHRWYSKNKMLNMSEFLGGKNGFIDESRQTTTSIFDVQIAKGGKKTIAIVLLKTNDREGDVIKIINFLKKNAYYEEVLE